MYEAFYHLPSNPFRLTPDPDFCFSHPGYKRAREYLEYALKLGEGVVMVTGRPGTGKTTLIESFMSLLDMSVIKSARIAASNLEADDLLRAIAYAYGIDAAGLDKATLRYRIRSYFEQQVQAGWRVLLIVDEAQSLPCAALEELRLLADLQVESRQLLQLFIVGQEQLREQMSDIAMEPFQQRVIANYHLVALNLTESRCYVEYRLRQAGWLGDPEITGGAIRDIYCFSKGIPRHINKLCNRLLLLGYGKGKHTLDSDDVQAITVEMSAEDLSPIIDDIADAATNVNAQEQAEEIPLADLAVKQDKLSSQHRPAGEVVMLPGSKSEQLAREELSGNSKTIVVGRMPARETPARSWYAALTSVAANWRAPAMTAVAFSSALMISIVLIDQIVPDASVVNPGSSNQLLTDKPAGVTDSGDAAVRAGLSLVMRKSPLVSVFSATDQPYKTGSDYLLQQILNDELPLPAAGVVPGSNILSSVTADRLEQSQAMSMLLRLAASENALTVQAPVRLTAVDELVLQGQRALQDYRLLTPARDSAYFYFQSALRLQPGSLRAAAGIEQIVERYTQLAATALEQQEKLKAHRYIVRGLSLQPDNVSLLGLREQSGMHDMMIVLYEAESSAGGGVGRGISRLLAGIKSFFTVGEQSDPPYGSASYQMTSSFVHE